jgi:hypothetical protein
MTHKVLLAAAAAIALFASVGATVAFPVTPIQSTENQSVQRVTFWARSFPYRYAWSVTRACTRYVPVETSRGPVMRRVWVCSERGRSVVSYRG